MLVYTRMFSLYFALMLTLCQKSSCSDSLVYQYEITEYDTLPTSFATDIFAQSQNERVRRDVDSTCESQEQMFLSDIIGPQKKRIEEKKVFDADSNKGMALAWAGDHGTMIVVTSQESFGIPTGASNIYRTEDFGRTFKNITSLLSKDEPIFIRKHAGIFRHPHDKNKVYLVSIRSTGTILFTTDDGGKTFQKTIIAFQMDGELLFHPTNTNFLLASASFLSVKTVYVSEDNGITWKRIADSVQAVKWGAKSKGDTDQTIYVTVDSSNTHPFFATFFDIKYDLKKSKNLGQSWTTIMENVISFGLQDKFIYVAIPESPKSRDRQMKVSTNGGDKWDNTYLPKMSGERFFSVLDMNEGLVFMHVDNPGDTGHGTLYTSSGKGMLYSESLQKHLYPNYGDTTDFYRVQSMRGVYLASQMRDDNSIHTVISYNLGGTWHSVPAPPGVKCKDTTKECSLQIHGAYSRARGIISELPLSVASAKGLLLVHGHVADALQTTKPDVFITSDGGYTWRKALDGPHHYHIADSGSLLVAVPADTSTPSTIKFSTDEGRCWHTYNYIDKNNGNDTIMFTGLLTEPGSKTLTVNIWGYNSGTKKWTTFIIDFQKVLKTQCNLGKDYEKWTPHENSKEKGNIDGCLLGQQETFQKVKKDSWCYNGLNVPETGGRNCKCVRDDYECDYGFYRPDGKDNCIKQPNFNLPEIDICKQGREEKIITKGYRKIPGDQCIGGFSPLGTYVDLDKECSKQNDDEIDVAQTAPTSKRTHNTSVIIAVFVVVALLVAIMAGFFIYKYVILRRHNVTYRYSLLNQNDGVSYDDELENALTKAGLYHDSSDDDEELNSPAVVKQNSRTSNGGSHIPKEQKTSRTKQVQNDVQSYHDDSDVDMLQ